MTRKQDQLNNEAVFKIVRTAEALVKRANVFFKKYKVTAAQYNVLDVLDSSTGRVNQNYIGDQLVVSRSNVTGIVDRLEKLGYVTREGDPRDRRVKFVSLTAKGRDLIERAGDDYFSALGEIMRFLGDKEKESIVKIVSKIEKGLV